MLCQRANIAKFSLQSLSDAAMFEAHFQTFEEPESGVALTARLSAFREELARRKLTGFVIPRADQQQNEYVAPSEERLAWLTGFTGSAGLAIVLTHEAALFVDGRYTLQAGKQVDGKAWTVESLIDPPPESWLAGHLKPGDRLGFDPWLHTSSAAERLAAGCAKAGAELAAVDDNPLDAIWTERPQPPLAPVAVHGAQFAGEAEADKLRRVRLEISRLGIDAAVLSDSHAVAWTFNIRGADVAHTPLPLSYALVPKDGRPTLFIDHRKLSNVTRDHLEQSADVAEPEALAPQLTALAQAGGTIAPFGPVPAIVGKDTSFSAPVSRRKVSSASTVSISVSTPFGASRSIQARNRASATASRRCAVRVPSISVRFFTAFSKLTGSLPRSGFPPAPAIRRLSASAAVALSSAIDAPRRASSVSFGVSEPGSSTSADCSR